MPEQAVQMKTVGEVAELAHVSVRALHHYDEVGLLTPSRRSDAGYRLYDEADLERLHEILLFRELGLPLDRIADVLGRPPADRAAALREHRRHLLEKRRRADAVLQAVDHAIDALKEGRTMTDDTLFQGFEDFDHARYAEEAEERWGDTDAYRESRRRTKSYGKAQWAAIQAEADDIMARFADLMREGADPASAPAMDLAEEHRRHIGASFYDCPPAMHAGLADMYEADPRFGEYFEKRAEGLTAFVSAAIRANSTRRTASD
jgi:DNA-binding transcriptional MerR regulator